MIQIDGAVGEGGGQMLRSSLALSLVTGQAFELINIRAGREKPGLLRQHMTCVEAAAALGQAQVEGNTLRSRTLRFTPQPMRGGDFYLDIGSAGSVNLVLQAILPAALFAPASSTWVITGGTHNEGAPAIDFLQRAFLPLLAQMGANVTVTLNKPGFYPRGGGKITAHIEPLGARGLQALSLPSRGALQRLESVSVLTNRLPEHIAQREHDTLSNALSDTFQPTVHFTQRFDKRTQSEGNTLFLSATFEHVTEVFTGFGAIGRPAEDVARRVLDEAIPFLRSNAPIGQHLADQLLLPLALGQGGHFRTLQPTLHFTTNVEIIQRFLPALRVELRPEGPDPHSTWGVSISS
jgi:RNA 3'-terminal phosphate cyclase (ATP)